MLARLVAEAASRYLEDVQHESVRVSFSNGVCVVRQGGIRASAWRRLGLPFEVRSARFEELRIQIGWSWRGLETAASVHVDGLHVEATAFENAQDAKLAALAMKRSQADRAEAANAEARAQQAWAARVLTRILDNASVTVTNLRVELIDEIRNPIQGNAAALVLRICKIRLKSSSTPPSLESSKAKSAVGHTDNARKNQDPHQDQDQRHQSMKKDSPKKKKKKGKSRDQDSGAKYTNDSKEEKTSPLAHKIVEVQGLMLGLRQEGEEDECIMKMNEAEAAVHVDATATHPKTGAPSILMTLGCNSGIHAPQLTTEMLEILVRISQRWAAFSAGDYKSAIRQPIGDTTVFGATSHQEFSATQDSEDALKRNLLAQEQNPRARWQGAFGQIRRIMRQHKRWHSEDPKDRIIRDRRVEIYTCALVHGVTQGPWMDLFVLECPSDVLIKAHLNARQRQREERIRQQQKEREEKEKRQLQDTSRADTANSWASWLRSLLPDDSEDTQEADRLNQERSRAQNLYRFWVTFTAVQVRADLVDDYGFPICSLRGSPSMVVREDSEAVRVNAAVEDLRFIVKEQDILHVLHGGSTTKLPGRFSGDEVLQQRFYEATDDSQESRPAMHSERRGNPPNEYEHNENPQDNEQQLSVGNSHHEQEEENFKVESAARRLNSDEIEDDDDDLDVDEFHDAASEQDDNEDDEDYSGEDDESRHLYAHETMASNLVNHVRLKEQHISLQRSKSDEILMGHAPLRVMMKRELIATDDAPGHPDSQPTSITVVVEPTEIDWAPKAFQALANFVKSTSHAINVIQDAGAGFLVKSLRNKTQLRVRFGAPRIRFDQDTILSLGALLINTKQMGPPVAEDHTPATDSPAEIGVSLSFEGTKLIRKGRPVIGPINITGNLFMVNKTEHKLDLSISSGEIHHDTVPSTLDDSNSRQTQKPSATIDEDLCKFIAARLRDVQDQSLQPLGNTRHLNVGHDSSSTGSGVASAIGVGSPRVVWEGTSALVKQAMTHVNIRWDALRIDLCHKDHIVFFVAMERASASLSLLDLEHFEIASAHARIQGFSCKHPNGRALLAQCSLDLKLEPKHLCVAFDDRLSLAWVPLVMADAWATLKCLGVSEDFIEDAMTSTLISPSNIISPRKSTKVRTRVSMVLPSGFALTLFKRWEPLAKLSIDALHLHAKPIACHENFSVACELENCTLYNLRADPNLLRNVISIETVSITHTSSAFSTNSLHIKIGSSQATFWQPFLTEWIDYASTGIVDLFTYSASEGVLSSSSHQWVHTIISIEPSTLKVPSDAKGSHLLSICHEGIRIENNLDEQAGCDNFTLEISNVRLQGSSGACIFEHKLVAVTLERSLTSSTSILHASLSNFHFNILEDGLVDLLRCLQDNVLNQRSVLNALLDVRTNQGSGENNQAGVRYWRHWIETKSKPQRANIKISSISARLLNSVVLSIDTLKANTLTRFVPAAHGFLFENEYSLKGVEVSISGVPVMRSISRMDLYDLMHGDIPESTNEFSLRLNHDPTHHTYVASLALDHFAIVLSPDLPCKAETLFQQLQASTGSISIPNLNAAKESESIQPRFSDDVAIDNDAATDSKVSTGQEIQLELEMNGARLGLVDHSGNRFELLLSVIGNATTTTVTTGQSSRIDKGTLHMDLSAALTDGQEIEAEAYNIDSSLRGCSSTTSHADPMAMTMTASMIDAMDDDELKQEALASQKQKQSVPLVLRPCSIELFWDLIDKDGNSDILTQQIRLELTSSVSFELAPGQAVALTKLVSVAGGYQNIFASRNGSDVRFLNKTGDMVSIPEYQEFRVTFSMAPLGLKLGPCSPSSTAVLEVRGYAKQCEEITTLKVALGDHLVSVNGQDLTSANHSVESAKQTLRDATWPCVIVFRRPNILKAQVIDPLQFRPLSTAIWTCRNCKSAQPLTKRDRRDAFNEKCMRCGAVHIQLSTEDEAEAVGEGTIVEDDVFENQRFYLLVGWSPQLLPTDPYPWSDFSGLEPRQLDAHASLPESPVPGAKWYWVDDWTVDESRSRSGGSGGWVYSREFGRFRKLHRLPRGTAKRTDCVRQRRWVRRRILSRESISHRTGAPTGAPINVRRDLKSPNAANFDPRPGLLTKGVTSSVRSTATTQYSFLLDTNQYELSVLLENDTVHGPLVRLRVGALHQFVPTSWIRALVFGTHEVRHSPADQGANSSLIDSTSVETLPSTDLNKNSLKSTNEGVHESNKDGNRTEVGKDGEEDNASERDYTGNISESANNRLPGVSQTMRKLVSKTNRFMPRRLAGNLCITAEAFNVGLLDWEPIVEPWAFAFEAQCETSWSLTLMGLSRLNLNVGFSIADAIAQLPGWGPLSNAENYLARPRAPLLALQNRSGVPLSACSSSNTSTSTEVDVEPGETIAAMQLLHSNTAAFDLWHNTGHQRSSLDDTISLRIFGGWQVLENISLRQLLHEGEIISHKLQQVQGRETGTVLLRVDAGPHGERLIHVESTIQISNACDFALSMRLEDSMGQGALMLDPCGAYLCAELPLVKNLELRMLRLGVIGQQVRNGFVVNLAQLTSSALQTARANLAKAVSAPGILMEENLTELAPGKHVLIDVHAEAVKECKTRPGALARRYAACKITIGARPPRTVGNRLKLNVEVRAEPNATHVQAIEPEGTVPLYHLDEVALSFRIPSVSDQWSTWVNMEQLALHGHGAFSLTDCHGRSVNVPLGFHSRQVTVGPALHIEDRTWGLGLQVGFVAPIDGHLCAAPGQASTDSIAVAEYQRWLPMQGWKAPSLPGDPNTWSYHPELHISASELNKVPLEQGWTWAEPEWHCDNQSHDWEYATDFLAERWSTERGKLDCVRRRIWRRSCVRNTPLEQVLLGPLSQRKKRPSRAQAEMESGSDQRPSKSLKGDHSNNNVSPTSSKYAIQLILRLSNQSTWSQPVALVPGTWTPVDVADELSGTVVSLVIQVPVLLHRESVTIWNQYELRNALMSDTLYVISTHDCVRSEDIPDVSRATKIQPGESLRRFHWDSIESGRLLRVGRSVQLRDGTSRVFWSGPVDPNVLDDMVLMLREPGGVGRALVYTSIRENAFSRTVLIHFGETLSQTVQAPYRIENRTLHTLECRQISRYSEGLDPLIVNDRRVCMFGLESAMGDSQGQVHIRAITEAGKVVEAHVNLLGEISTQQKEMEPIDSTENRIIVRVFAEGATRVICVAHAWAIVEAPPYVDEKVHLRARCELQGGISVSIIGIHRELLAMHAEGLSVSCAETDTLRTLDCSLTSLQVDDTDPNTRVPVMLHMGPVRLGVATYVRFPRRVKLFTLRLFPLAMHLAKQQIRALTRFYEVLCARALRHKTGPLSLQDPSSHSISKGEERTPLSFDLIHVHSISARVSLTSSATTQSLPLAELMRRRAGSDSLVRKRASTSVSALEVVGAAIARVTDLDDVSLPYWAVALGHLLRSDLRDHDVRFGELVLHHAAIYDMESSAIAQHYLAQLAKGLASTVGSGLFRAPLHFARQVSMGMSGVLARGPRSSIEDGATGLVASTAMLSESVFKGLARGLATMSLSDEYIRRRQDREERLRERRTSDKAPRFREAINEGAMIVRNSVSEGVVGLLAEPVQGGRDYGPMGFIGGIGKGMVGVAIKPMMGVLDAATVATQSMRPSSSRSIDASTNKPTPLSMAHAAETVHVQSLKDASQALQHRRRYPRALYGSGLRIAPYSEEDAIAVDRLRSLHGTKFTSEVFFGRFQPSKEDVEYIVTDCRILCFHLQTSEEFKDDKLQWSIDFADVQSALVTRDPASGVHIRYTAIDQETASRFVGCPPDEAYAFCSLLLTAPRG